MAEISLNSNKAVHKLAHKAIYMYHHKGEGNFQNNLCWFNTGPPLLPKYIGEKAHNAPKVELLALK